MVLGEQGVQIGVVVLQVGGVVVDVEIYVIDFGGYVQLIYQVNKIGVGLVVEYDEIGIYWSGMIVQFYLFGVGVVIGVIVGFKQLYIVVFG